MGWWLAVAGWLICQKWERGSSKVGAMIVSFTNSKPATSRNQQRRPFPVNKGLEQGHRAPMGWPGAFEDKRGPRLQPSMEALIVDRPSAGWAMIVSFTNSKPATSRNQQQRPLLERQRRSPSGRTPPLCSTPSKTRNGWTANMKIWPSLKSAL